jgi:hypothetical protein
MADPLDRRFRRRLKRIERWLLPPAGVLLVVLGLMLLVEHARGTSHLGSPINILVVGKDHPATPYGWMGNLLHRRLTAKFGAGTVERIDTKGSLDSLIQIDALAGDPGERPLTLAIVQADVLHHYMAGGHPQFQIPHADSNARSIARLFSERLEFSYCPNENHWFPPAQPSQADEQMDCSESCLAPATPSGDSEQRLLERQDICGAAVGSGTLVTLLNVARVLGAEWSRRDPCSVVVPMLSVRGRSFPLEESRARTCSFGMSCASARVVSSAFPGLYTPTRLASGHFVEQPSSAYTLRWDAVLVGHRDLAPAVVGAIEELLVELDAQCQKPPAERDFSELPEEAKEVLSQTNYCDVVYEDAEASIAPADSCSPVVRGKQFSPKRRFQKLGIAPHPTLVVNSLDAVSRFAVFVTSGHAIRAIVLLLLGVSLLASLSPNVGVAVRAKAKFGRLINIIVDSRKDWAGLLIKGLAFHVLIGICIWLSEFHEHALKSNAEFVRDGIGGAMRWMLDFIVFGSSPVELQSALAVMWVGFLKASWLLASVALSIGLLATLVRWLKLREMQDHVVIVGESPHTPLICRELDAQAVQHRAMWSSQEPVNVPQDGRPSDFHESALEARLAEARAVIVLADEERAKRDKAGDVDTWVCRQIVEVRRELSSDPDSGSYWSKRARAPKRKVRVVAELRNEQNTDLATAAGADEVLCLARFGSELLGQLAAKPGLSSVFRELLRTTTKNQEVYFDALTAEQVARLRTFDRAVRSFTSDPTCRRIPIGIRRSLEQGTDNAEILLNPLGQSASLQRGDQLVVIAEDAQGKSLSSALLGIFEKT